MTSPDRTPLLVVADDDPDERGLIAEELERRYGSDYAVRICTTAELEGVLDQAEADGADVAVALASGKEGADLLARMRGRFPTARRGLLIPWLGWSRRGVGELVLRSMARGWIDLYVIAPTRRRDEVFHRTISELLQESERLRGEGPAGATVVADARSPRAHQLRSSLAGLGIPHRTVTADNGQAPAVTLADGQVLTDPEPAELTRALGFPTELDSHEADLVVVGAGPAGPERRRVRRLGGPADDRARRGRRRRPGGLELADPQLPRLSARPRRRRARAARVPAGVALRGAVPAHPPRVGARAARRQARRPHRQRRRDRRTGGRARARGRVPPPRRPRPDRARGRGRLLRRLDVGGPGAGRRERLHRRRRQLGRAGGAPPGPLRLHRSGSSSAATAWRRRCRST